MAALSAEALLAATRDRGIDFWTGVPCSFLTPIINTVISDPGTPYVGAASEGEAVAIAAGAWLAGSQTVVMCQNSGLGNTVNPLTSMNWPFRIPTLMLVTWRGQPGLEDEPQHELMGEITSAMLDVMRIPNSVLPREASALGAALDGAMASMQANDLPYAFVVPQGSVADAPLVEPPRAPRGEGTLRRATEGGSRPTRMQALEQVLACVPEAAAIIATTGKTGRELFTLADRPQHLYQVGSMGCASAMGLGVALRVERPVVVLDGDGAALMKLGNLSTIGAAGPENLTHIVLDNGVHDSTGGQSTASASVDFAAAAIACGYRAGATVDGLDGLARVLTDAIAGPGPTLIHARIAAGSAKNLGRPTVKPPQVARRFKAFLQT